MNDEVLESMGIEVNCDGRYLVSEEELGRLLNVEDRYGTLVNSYNSLLNACKSYVERNDTLLRGTLSDLLGCVRVCIKDDLVKKKLDELINPLSAYLGASGEADAFQRQMDEIEEQMHKNCP